MSYRYDPQFMRYASHASRQSAEIIVALVRDALHPRSVLDVGCARGAWVSAWLDAGVADAHGVDGDYVSRDDLDIAADRFTAAELARPLQLGRRFDLVESLEVAEHLPSEASATFIENLVSHAERFVLFSAAPPGQGGEHHVNERSYDEWRQRFAASGFSAFDFVRPRVLADERVSYWYRYNLLLYVRNGEIASLPAAVARTAIAPDAVVPDVAPLSFRARKAIVRRLPPGMQDRIAQMKARVFPTGRF